MFKLLLTSRNHKLFKYNLHSSNTVKMKILLLFYGAAVIFVLFTAFLELGEEGIWQSAVENVGIIYMNSIYAS